MGKDRSKDTVEELITEASRLLQPLLNPRDGDVFDSMEYRDVIRWIKRKIDNQMKESSISIVTPGAETAINPRFKELCIQLREMSISHASQGRYGLELESCVELVDLLASIENKK